MTHMSRFIPCTTSADACMPHTCSVWLPWYGRLKKAFRMVTTAAWSAWMPKQRLGSLASIATTTYPRASACLVWATSSGRPAVVEGGRRGSGWKHSAGGLPHSCCHSWRGRKGRAGHMKKKLKWGVCQILQCYSAHPLLREPALTVAGGAYGPRPKVARIVRAAVEKRQRGNWSDRDFVKHCPSKSGVVGGREERLAQRVQHRAAQRHGRDAAAVQHGICRQGCGKSAVWGARAVSCKKGPGPSAAKAQTIPCHGQTPKAALKLTCGRCGGGQQHRRGQDRRCPHRVWSGLWNSSGGQGQHGGWQARELGFRRAAGWCSQRCSRPIRFRWMTSSSGHSFQPHQGPGRFVC